MTEISKSDVKAANRGYREALQHGGMLPGDLESFAQFVKDHPERFPILNKIARP